MTERPKTPGLGAAHTCELQNIFDGGDLTDLLVRFVATLDPNDPKNASAVYWPAWEDCADGPEMLALVSEGNVTQTVIKDTFRKEAIEFLVELGLKEPL